MVVQMVRIISIFYLFSLFLIILFCAYKYRNLSNSNFYPVAKVTVTCYYSVPDQTDSDPFITAFNVRPRWGTIAVSRDLLDLGFIPFSKVWIEGFGEFIVLDIMNKRYENRVDIWVPEGTRPFKYDNVRMVGYCPCFVEKPNADNQNFYKLTAN